MTFGTDPATLEHDDLVGYARQLIDTVLRWQYHAAAVQGKTRDQMLTEMKRLLAYNQEGLSNAWALVPRITEIGDIL